MERSHEDCEQGLKGTGLREGQERMDKNYMDVMMQSLKKKVQILEQLTQLNKQQTFLLQDPNLSPEDFESNLASKSALIDDLNQLDIGFESLYAKVKSELEMNRQQYTREIAQMQEYIRIIMEKSNMLQAQEARNKEKVLQKFADVRKQVKEVRKSQRVVKQYYESMAKQNFNTSQFVDNKK